MKLKICDIIYGAFPTQEGGSLPHYGLVVGLDEKLSGEVYAKVVYSTTKKVDPAQNANQHSTDLVVTETNFGKDFWGKSGMEKPCRFDCSITANIPVKKIAGSIVGHLDIHGNPKAFNALRRAMLNAH